MVVTDAGILTVTERCLHTLTPAPQQQLPSPDLAPAPMTTERKPAQDSGHYSHSTIITPCTTPLQSHAGITHSREHSTGNSFLHQ